MSGKIPSGHAVINCLSQTNSSHLECSPEHSGGWAQSSPACVGLHGAEVRGEAQYVLEKVCGSRCLLASSISGLGILQHTRACVPIRPELS
eukprot:1159534-Pelagomonas_calceolata.AAC.8